MIFLFYTICLEIFYIYQFYTESVGLFLLKIALNLFFKITIDQLWSYVLIKKYYQISKNGICDFLFEMFTVAVI